LCVPGFFNRATEHLSPQVLTWSSSSRAADAIVAQHFRADERIRIAPDHDTVLHDVVWLNRNACA
jgi:hypothetical protein